MPTNRKLQIVFALIGVVVEDERVLKREFWDRALTVMRGDERAGEIIGGLLVGIPERFTRASWRVVVL
jgi:hypothetical protein